MCILSKSSGYILKMHIKDCLFSQALANLLDHAVLCPSYTLQAPSFRVLVGGSKVSEKNLELGRSLSEFLSVTALGVYSKFSGVSSSEK